MAEQRVAVDVDGRTLTLSNLEKVLYPEDGFTKGAVIDYYARICETLLPHVTGRPATFRRFPNGVDAPSFFEKNAPRGTPDWVRTVRLPVPGSTMQRDTIDFVVVEDRPTLVWAANLASLEVHVPQWRVGARGAVHGADLLVLDLDPGPPATVVECCQVALLLRDVLVADGLEPVAKTSGSKGLQVYAAVRETSADRTVDVRARAGQAARGRASGSRGVPDDQDRCGRTRCSSTGHRTTRRRRPWRRTRCAPAPARRCRLP